MDVYELEGCKTEAKRPLLIIEGPNFYERSVFIHKHLSSEAPEVLSDAGPKGCIILYVDDDGFFRGWLIQHNRTKDKACTKTITALCSWFNENLKLIR